MPGMPVFGGMPGLSMPSRPPTPEQTITEYRAAEVEREQRTIADPDEMRDEAPSHGRGAWLVVLLVILGFAGLFLLMYWLAGVV